MQTWLFRPGPERNNFPTLQAIAEGVLWLSMPSESHFSVDIEVAVHQEPGYITAISTLLLIVLVFPLHKTPECIGGAVQSIHRIAVGHLLK